MRACLGLRPSFDMSVSSLSWPAFDEDLLAFGFDARQAEELELEDLAGEEVSTSTSYFLPWCFTTTVQANDVSGCSRHVPRGGV